MGFHSVFANVVEKKQEKHGFTMFLCFLSTNIIKKAWFYSVLLLRYINIYKKALVLHCIWIRTCSC